MKKLTNIIKDALPVFIITGISYMVSRYTYDKFVSPKVSMKMPKASTEEGAE